MSVTKNGPLWQSMAEAVEKELKHKFDRYGMLRLYIEWNARRDVRKRRERSP